MSAQPAQLGYLAIYNPSLGTTDDTIDEQIVYYASQSSLSKKRRYRRRGGLADAASPEERNERLRQIGLAQGMVEFGKSFAGGQAVDFVETGKSRVIVHELEKGWWILASIDLTRLPLPPKLATGKHTTPVEDKFEYSMRDVKPASLLLRDLIRAHSIFLLHHTPSLSSFLEHHKRSRFLAVLGRYWDLFLSTWDVVLHGNPIRNLLSGINLAASGELGVGVGEEELGSGEREVLEGLPWRMAGLVDIVVSKFSTPEPEDNDALPRPDGSPPPKPQWIGSGREPAADDGAIFLGVGALSRESLRDIVQWTEDLYSWGENTYAVVNPSSAKSTRKSRRGTISGGGVDNKTIRKSVSLRRRNSIAEDNLGTSPRRRLRAVLPIPMVDSVPVSPQTPGHPEGYTLTDQQQQQQQQGSGIPETLAEEEAEAIIPPQEGSVAAKAAAAAKATTTTTDIQPPMHSETASKAVEATDSAPEPFPSLPGSLDIPISTSPSDNAMDKFKSYLKLGYGTYWSLGGTDASKDDKSKLMDPVADIALPDPRKSEDTANYFMIGLRKEQDGPLTEEDESDLSDTGDPPVMRSKKIQRRTVRVNLAPSALSTAPAEGEEAVPLPTKLRVVVYVNRPFIFVLLFDPAKASRSLATEAVYRTLHEQLAPLRDSLVLSTSRRVPRPSPGIFDITYDPISLTILCSVPNIPVPASGVPAAANAFGNVEGRKELWSRQEATSIHAQLLNVRAAVEKRPGEFERSCKTNRGWWIVWTRVFKELPEESSSMTGSGGLETIIESPVGSFGYEERGRRDSGASEQVVVQKKKARAVAKEIFLVRRASDHVAWRSFGAGLMDDGTRLAGGIGMDTRKYVEGLLSVL